MALLAAKFFEAYLSYETLDFGWRKVAKFGICGKVFNKVCFFDKRKDK